MKRREFISLIGAAAAWPLAARAQQVVRPPTIGFLGATTPTIHIQRTAAFMQRLRELGWNEGRNVAIEVRWAEGRNERAAEIAAAFASLKVDVIVTSGLPAVTAAKQATSTTPIVFAILADPVGSGVVASLSRPGGNVTGLSNQSPDLAGKRLELLREVVPGLRRLAIIANRGNRDGSLDLQEAQAAATALGIDVINLDIRRREDVVPAFETVQGKAEALYVVADPLINTNSARIHTMVIATRLPAMYNNREQVEAGGLISYGPNFPDLWRRAAEYVDRILRGAAPADLPVEQPTKFDLVINATTAKALHLEIPAALLARADEVIE